jgi:4-amino-4-deoxy-L-arabinose transferase
LLILGLFLLLYIAPLGLRSVIIPDESRYAEIPREMIASGDWIVPHLNGVRYFEKPVLGYWINAASMILLGGNAFAARLPSALATGLSSLLLFFMVRRFTDRDSVGVLTAVVFLTSLEVFGLGTFNVLDNLLSFFITGAMVSFFFGYMAKVSWKKNSLLALFGVFCGLAFLTKGFVAMAVPIVAVVPFMLWERRLKDILRICWIPVLAAIVVSLPWVVMIHVREPDFWRFFFWNEHIKRFLAENAQHRQSFWYFFLILPGAALPWTFVFPVTVRGLKQTVSGNVLIRFVACWFLFPFLFFSVARGKLLTYILPCFPALAILVAMGLHEYTKGGRKKAFTVGTLVLALVVAIPAIVLPIVQVTGFLDLKPYAHTWQWALAITGLLSWTLFLLASSRASEWPKKILLYAIAPILLMALGPLLLPDLVAEQKTPEAFLLSYAHRIRPDTLLVSDEDPLGAVCWCYKRNDVYLLGDVGELGYGLGYDDAKHRCMNLLQFKDLILEKDGSYPVILVAKAKNYAKWEPDLPEPLLIDTNGEDGFVFVQF